MPDEKPVPQYSPVDREYFDPEEGNAGIYTDRQPPNPMPGRSYSRPLGQVQRSHRYVFGPYPVTSEDWRLWDKLMKPDERKRWDEMVQRMYKEPDLSTDSETDAFIGEMIKRYQDAKGWVPKRWKAPDFKNWKPSWETEKEQ